MIRLLICTILILIITLTTASTENIYILLVCLPAELVVVIMMFTWAKPKE